MLIYICGSWSRIYLFFTLYKVPTVLGLNLGQVLRMVESWCMVKMLSERYVRC